MKSLNICRHSSSFCVVSVPTEEVDEGVGPRPELVHRPAWPAFPGQTAGEEQMADVEVSTRRLPGARAQSQISRQGPRADSGVSHPKQNSREQTPVSGEPEEAEEFDLEAVTQCPPVKSLDTSHWHSGCR